MNFRGPNATWWKIATVFLPLLAAVIIAFTRVQETVGHLEKEMGTKASQEVMQLNQEAILRELTQIQARLDRLVPR